MTIVGMAATVRAIMTEKTRAAIVITALTRNPANRLGDAAAMRVTVVIVTVMNALLTRRVMAVAREAEIRASKADNRWAAGSNQPLTIKREAFAAPVQLQTPLKQPLLITVLVKHSSLSLWAYLAVPAHVFLPTNGFCVQLRRQGSSNSLVSDDTHADSQGNERELATNLPAGEISKYWKKPILLWSKGDLVEDAWDLAAKLPTEQGIYMFQARAPDAKGWINLYLGKAEGAGGCLMVVLM